MCVPNKMIQTGRTMLMLTLGMIVAGILAASQLHAQSFTVSQNGKSVGTASLSLKPASGAFSSTSGAKIDMPGLKYSFNENAQLGSDSNLLNVHLTGSVNGTPATIDTTPTSGATPQFQMKISANGKLIDTPLAFHPRAIFMPDFDPGALQAILNLGAAHNNRDLWALIPKQSGSITPIKIVTNADMQGTLGGKPVEVHHLTVSYDSSKTELFSSPANELLQAELPDEGFAMVRQGFKLTPPARAPAAPPSPNPAPAQQPSGQAAQPQQ